MKHYIIGRLLEETDTHYLTEYGGHKIEWDKKKYKQKEVLV